MRLKSTSASSGNVASTIGDSSLSVMMESLHHLRLLVNLIQSSQLQTAMQVITTMRIKWSKMLAVLLKADSLFMLVVFVIDLSMRSKSTIKMQESTSKKTCSFKEEHSRMLSKAFHRMLCRASILCISWEPLRETTTPSTINITKELSTEKMTHQLKHLLIEACPTKCLEENKASEAS